ncbi:MAG: PHB depolymerase family esterase [Anaerolineales bacterium]
MDKRYKFISAFLILVIATLACRRTATTSNDPLHTLTFDGMGRTYILHVPTSYDGSQAVPLVLDFHGGGGNANTQMRTSDFSTLADEKGFIVAYPNGTGRHEDKLLTWNGGTCCAYAVEHQIDDVGFIRAVVSEISSQYKIDPKRIYATGLSNGAIFSYRLACDASDIFAAVAPVAGTLNYIRCAPSQPVSIIHFHGTEDSHVGYYGGSGPNSLVDVPFKSVKDSIDFWLNADQCDVTPQTDVFSDIQHDMYLNCENGTAIELYTIIGGKHAWPGSDGPAWTGGDQPTQTISATKLIWDFFVTHPKL